VTASPICASLSARQVIAPIGVATLAVALPLLPASAVILPARNF
jgi:hypothetical protein